MATEQSEGGRVVSPTTHQGRRGQRDKSAGKKLVEQMAAELREVEHGNMMAADFAGTCVVGGDPIRYNEPIARRWRSGEWSHVNCVMVARLAQTQTRPDELSPEEHRWRLLAGMRR
jgi:hypothetical protein